ncbi:uncharacterized protein [Antedon mediterranea]|uniref:uncharacterized protein n=1 Tax=Antedon mediterranea TaxID=105859 RepID=UPI003AF4C12E
MEENFSRSSNEGKERVCSSSSGSSSSSSAMSDCPPSSNGGGGGVVIVPNKSGVVVKKEPSYIHTNTTCPDDVSDYAQNTMNELLAIYGYEGVDKSVTRQLHLINFSQKESDPEGQVPTSEVEDDSNSQESVQMQSTSPRISSNGSAEQQPISQQSDSSSEMNTSQTDNKILCDWCKSYRPKLFTLSTSTQTKAFCSERCFAACRRAYIKPIKKICNWCKHSRHNTEYVTYQHGSQTLQFCSGKCLAQYKKNEDLNDNNEPSDMNYSEGATIETLRKRPLLEARSSATVVPSESVGNTATNDSRTVLVNSTYKNQPLNLTSPLPNTRINLLPTTQLMPGQMFSPFQTINSPIFQFPTLMQPHQMLVQQPPPPLVINQHSNQRSHRGEQDRMKHQDKPHYRTSENATRKNKTANTSANGCEPETTTALPTSLLPPTTIMVPHPVFVPIPIPIPIPIPVPTDKFSKIFENTFANLRPESEEPVSTKVTSEEKLVEKTEERNSLLTPQINIREKRKLLPKPKHNPSYMPVQQPYASMSSHQPPPECFSPADPVSLHRPQFVMLNRPPPNKLPIPRMPRKPPMKERDDVLLKISDKYPRQLSASTSQLNGIEKIGNAESSSKVREALRCHLTRRLSQSAVNLVEAAKLKVGRTTADELRRSLSLGRLNEDQENKLSSKVSHSLGNLHDSMPASGSRTGATVTDEQIRQDAAHTAIRPDNLKRPLDSDVYRLMDLKLKRKRFLADMDA